MFARAMIKTSVSAVPTSTLFGATNMRKHLCASFFLIFFPFLHNKESRYLSSLRIFFCFVIQLCIFLYPQGTISYEFDKGFFKIVVIKCILEIVRSFLLRPVIFYGICRFLFWYLLSLTVFNRWQYCYVKYQIYAISFT